MREDQMNNSEFANKRLRAAGRAKDKAKRLAWGFLVGATILEVLLAVALIDYWLSLPVPLRMGGFIVLLLLLAVGLAGWLKLRRRPTSLKEAALDTEAQRPELGCVISTAAEYASGQRPVTHEYEPELVEALKAQAARNLGKVQISYNNRWLRPAGFLAFALVTVLLFAVAAPVALTAFKRTVSPWSKETYTKVEVSPGSADIPVGGDLDITNVFSGRVPKNPALRWQEADQTVWQFVALKKSEDGFYIHPFKNLRNSVKYQVTGNDAASAVYEITTYVPPEARAIRIDINYPDYTGVKPYYQQTSDLTVLRASDLRLRITASTKLSKARLRFSSLPSIDLTPVENDQWVGSFKAATNADYWIELADAKGHQGVNEQPYHLKVLPDNPPKVEIVAPGQDIRAEATNTIPIRISATDDFGVTEIKVLYHRLGGPEQALNCVFTNGQKGEVMGGVELALAGLELKEYELVAYHAEAKDNNTLDGPGIGVSPVYFIEITNQEGGQPNAKPKSEEGEKLNLLVIQKQIIADTTALPPKAAAEKFGELASRQTAAAEFAEAYRDSLTALGAPAEATKLMEAVLQEMKSASGSLTDRKRESALPPEEKALADLYQILKLLPQLANLPTQPPPTAEPPPNPALSVVLEAIRKQKKEPPSNEEIVAALEDAKQLSRSQAELLPSLEPAEKGSDQSKASSDRGTPDGEKQSQQAKADEKSSEQKEAEAAKAKAVAGKGKEGSGRQPGDPKGGKEGQEAKTGANPGSGKKGEEAKSDPKPEEEKKGDEAKADPKSGEEKEKPTPDKLAESENQLSKETAALAEKLQKLAGKDIRLGHNAARKAAQAAGQMGAAAQSLRQGNFGAAGTEGGQSLLDLDKVIAALERLLNGQPNLTDVASEDFPKEYEALISEYLRKLSHEK